MKTRLHRKGTETSPTSVIVGLLLTLAVAALLWVAFRNGWNPLHAFTNEAQACEGGINKGTCVSSESDCQGSPSTRSLTCKDEKTPVCCLNNGKIIGAGGGSIADIGYNDCKAGTWKDCSKCRARFTDMSVNRANPLFENTPFVITCYANANDLPCYASPTAMDESGQSVPLICTGQTNSDPGKSYFSWDCQGLSAGRYVISCALQDVKDSNTNHCCIGNPERDQFLPKIVDVITAG
jgi:hypothetical protein